MPDASNRPEKSVLIICFVFPPSPGIGGRRWAKFAKYLARQGVTLNVITAEPQSKEVSAWEKDLKAAGINRHFFDSGYPSILGRYPVSVLDKLRYRLHLFKARRRTHGNYYDRSIYCEKHLVDEIMRQWEREPFQKLIVSGGPFAYLHYVMKLKERLSGAEFIVDFRDPWTNNHTAFGFEGLSQKRLAVEKEMEENVISTFDKVITVSEAMTEYFSRFRDAGIFTLHNGFDPEDFLADDSAVSGETGSGSRIVFVGTVYTKSTGRIFEFLDHLPDHCSLDIYGDGPMNFDRALAHYPNARFHGRVPLENR